MTPKRPQKSKNICVQKLAKEHTIVEKIAEIDTKIPETFNQKTFNRIRKFRKMRISRDLNINNESTSYPVLCLEEQFDGFFSKEISSKKPKKSMF